MRDEGTVRPLCSGVSTSLLVVSGLLCDGAYETSVVVSRFLCGCLYAFFSAEVPRLLRWCLDNFVVVCRPASGGVKTFLCCCVDLFIVIYRSLW